MDSIFNNCDNCIRGADSLIRFKSCVKSVLCGDILKAVKRDKRLDPLFSHTTRECLTRGVKFDRDRK